MMLTEKNLLPRLLYPGRLSFKIEGYAELSREKKVKEIYHHKTKLKQNVKGSSLSRKEKVMAESKKIKRRNLTSKIKHTKKVVYH